MSKQFRFYLLPSDTERLLEALRSSIEFEIISPRSPTLTATPLQSPFSEYVYEATQTKFQRVNCYLKPPWSIDLQMSYLPKQECWAVKDSSEVIEFSGCDYDQKTLGVGRFYSQTDQLIGDALYPKRSEFLAWCDQIFRVAKSSLKRSKEFNAYLGEDAVSWMNNGGIFKEI